MWCKVKKIGSKEELLFNAHSLRVNALEAHKRVYKQMVASGETDKALKEAGKKYGLALFIGDYQINIPVSHPLMPNDFLSKNKHKIVESTDYASMSSENLHAMVEAALGGDGKAVLYEGCEKNDVNAHRKMRDFIAYMEERRFSGELVSPCKMRDDPKARSTSQEACITLDALLGKEGADLYRNAYRAEVDSQTFRDHLFISSITHHEGYTPERPMHARILGASGTGKSTSGQAALDKIGAKIAAINPMHDEEGKQIKLGFDAIWVDGGKVRELLQMRHYVNSLAKQLGYALVTDIDKGLPCPRDICARAAQASKNRDFSIVEPITCADPREEIREIGEPLHQGYTHLYIEVDAMSELAQEPFLRKKGISTNEYLKAVTLYNGRKRARHITTPPAEPMLGEDYQPPSLNASSDMEFLREGKPYQPQHYDRGRDASRKVFMEQANYEIGGGDAMVYLAKAYMDLVFVKEVNDEWKVVWPGDKDAQPIGYRNLLLWREEKSRNNNVKPLFDWVKENHPKLDVFVEAADSKTETLLNVFENLEANGESDLAEALREEFLNHKHKMSFGKNLDGSPITEYYQKKYSDAQKNANTLIRNASWVASKTSFLKKPSVTKGLYARSPSSLSSYSSNTSIREQSDIEGWIVSDDFIQLCQQYLTDPLVDVNRFKAGLDKWAAKLLTNLVVDSSGKRREVSWKYDSSMIAEKSADKPTIDYKSTSFKKRG